MKLLTNKDRIANLTEKLTYGFRKNGTVVTLIGTKWYNCDINSDNRVQLLHSLVNFSG